MEIPEINMITDFQAGMKCLQNPSLVVPKFRFYFSFWKWGALFLAIYATFSSLMRRLKLIFVYFRSVKPSLLQQKLEQILELTDDEDDDVSSASSTDDDEEEDDNDEEEEDYFRVKGSRLWLQSQWQNGNLACNCTKNSVVRFWDNLGLSLDFDEDLINYDPNDVVSTWGFESSSNIPFTAESDGKGAGVIVRGYDGRMRRRTPAIHGEWRATASEDVSAAASSGKVFVRDDAGGVLAVGDVRNMRVPLNNRTAGGRC